MLFQRPDDLSARVGALKERYQIASLIPERGVAIELGTCEAFLTEALLAHSSAAHVYTVDMYASDRGHDVEQYRRAVERLEPYRDRYTLLRMRFDEAVAVFPDESFDFVYVDGYAHTGEEGGETFRQWFPKVKRGGIFGGDDYDSYWPLVVEQVDRFVATHKLNSYVTQFPKRDENRYPFPSWFVRKP
jgi:hypothetical protein